jgi:hypothetical protein
MMRKVLLLLQSILVALHKQNLFVDAKHESILRGSQLKKQLGDGLPRFDLPDASATQNQRLLKDDKNPTSADKGGNDDKGGKGPSKDEDPVPSSSKEGSGPNKKDKNENDKNDRAGDKEDKNENDKNDNDESNKNDQESPTLSPVAHPVSAPTDKPMVLLTMAPSSTSIKLNPVPVPTISATSDPTVTLVLDPETSPPIDLVSEPIITDPAFVQPPDPAPTLNLIPPTDLVSARIMAPSVYTANHNGDQRSDIEFDKTKFVAVERLQPIKFDMTVSEYTQLMNTEKLDAYFKDFIENVLDMRSNRDWYPFNYKSVHNITMELLPMFGMEGDKKERSTKLEVPVQLILNGLIFVHLNDQDSQQTISINDSVTRSIFHDSFDHSMLLFFTFWGVDRLQEVLEEDGGIQNPVVNSVIVGNKQLITIDKDGNYFAYMDEGDGPSNSLALETSNFEKDSSARSSKYGVSSLIMISASTIWLCM